MENERAVSEAYPVKGAWRDTWREGGSGGGISNIILSLHKKKAKSESEGTLKNANTRERDRDR